ncbi:tRNA (adenosine(37)-N6)-threonylcarbamoyltransferase complex dimerization subunit type 1 TsaB [Agromyces atrinae]|uniref:tRNA (Adenosine(37)-N6)-threonylcarbamoyltransferase complex dimerization subunit type 1 TsaB n=1 Tax=Agromyces atrinae TaxID=592376 RepID=A0A4Q2M687_9MICO|nr:tRNA (adenosine(37)-N6)-threonylcarbamoyltransferase complex dimerization subunit type 1 TsaB [Agromyces atrinae]MCI2957854.1 tRNA (adenosine(37)-N6)-threonylcarbamoyltransferase complex dimerization subunit type 1 TsaB [Agromyces atrinae]NYD66840.1 tRNA threonylcarbamoyl adenosine modification protein YeaZ [Agromyces atrinae]RXZ87489.1 tRNA (adenosine(37)-N6)-threonylcarbamoyltransferase complex dimerization subunit type 1 TsaB [Agromyces atrinae]
MLLAIDTSAGTSVAVVDAEAGILAENGTPDTMRHAEVIGGLLERTLTDAGIERSQLSGVVAGMGPGPFTGLRVGIAAARAFALGLGKPVVPVMSHDAVAWEWYRAGNVGPLLVVTDARRREVAWSRYSTLDAAGLPELLDGPALAKAIEVPEFDAERLDAATISAGALGMVAELRWLARRPFAADEPVYLRSPDVTLSTAKRVS